MTESRDDGSQAPTSELWKDYLRDWDDTQQMLHRRSREFRESPEAHPVNGYLIHRMRSHQSRNRRVVEAIHGEAHTYIDQQTRDGRDYGVCVCEAMIPGILGVDWSQVEFLQQPGHRPFPHEMDEEPT